jgi:hypothetical protein
MRKRVFLLAMIGASLLETANMTVALESARDSFAVVELFTSEGCSSCPPADQVLAELADDAKKNGRRIFPLAFHVDYWNYLGWKDPYGLALSSERQEQYGAALRVNQSYTPQMVVNGSAEFVGSDRRRARKAVDAALAPPAQARVTLRVKADGDGQKIQYQVSDAPKDAVLCVAVVESGLVSQVRRGENAGHTLSHTNVVRKFVTLPLGGLTGSVVLESEFSSSKRDLQVIAFVQDSRTLAIFGATGIHL